MNRIRDTLSARAAFPPSGAGDDDRWSDRLRTAADPELEPETDPDLHETGALFPLTELERETHFKRSFARTALSMLLILAGFGSIVAIVWVFK